MPTRRAFVLSSLALAAAASPLLRPAFAHPHEELTAERLGDVERQVLAFRASLKDAIAAKDVAALRRLYDPAFTHTHGSGKTDGRDARIVALLAGDPVIETAPASELSVRVHGPDVAVVTGRSPIPNVGDGRTYEFRWLQVLVRSGGEWRLAASQATRLPATS